MPLIDCVKNNMKEKLDIGLLGAIIEGCSRGLMAYYRVTLDGAKNILKEPK